MSSVNHYTLHLSRSFKQLIMIILDGVMMPLALLMAFALLYGQWFPEQINEYLGLFALVPIITLPVFLRLGLYRAVIQFLGLQAGMAILKGVSFVTLLMVIWMYSVNQSLPTSIPVIFWLIAILYVGASRLLIRLYFHWLIQNFRPKEPVIIYGAGSSGVQLATALQSGNQYLPIAFVDDNQPLQDHIIHGVRVYPPSALQELVESYGIQQILLAVPSASHRERKAILNLLERLPVHVKTVPELYDLTSGRLDVDEVREVDIEDLLGRDIVPPNPSLLGACITGKSVMVTGAGGSIGSELCRQIVQLKPCRLVLYDMSEFGLYQIDTELITILGEDSSIDLIALLGNVQDSIHLQKVLQEYEIETLYHAAAYKHVPIVEKNIIHGVQNNLFGTLNAAQAANKAGVLNFVLISTDKAVRPTNIMGATKRFAELVLQALAKNGSKTRYSMVRFGNVLGSSGSVVPLFRQQIQMGGPVTVTHPEVTRYFMTVQEAAQLVIQAGSMSKGGDVFVLDMHEPIRISDLAKKMIHLMGYEVHDEKATSGVAIEYTGLRPGEKLHEELLIGEYVTGTKHPKIMKAEEDYIAWETLEPFLREMESACKEYDCDYVLMVFQKAVDGFQAEEELADLLWLKEQHRSVRQQASGKYQSPVSSQALVDHPVQSYPPNVVTEIFRDVRVGDG